MVETSRPSDRAQQPSYRDFGRIRSYAVAGVLVVLALAAVVLLAALNIPGPGLLTADVAIWVLALCVAVLALGLFYVLFTLRSTLRVVRTQATEVAVARSMDHTHRVAVPGPPAWTQLGNAPAIEYITRPKDASPGTVARTAVEDDRTVEVLEGVGPTFARRLRMAGIETVAKLRLSSDDDVARAAGVNSSVAHQWRVMARLLVLPEVDPQGAELLSHCDIGTVQELSRQDASSLYRRAVRANRRGAARLMPQELTRERVESWIQAARQTGAEQEKVRPSVEASPS